VQDIKIKGTCTLLEGVKHKLKHATLIIKETVFIDKQIYRATSF